MSLLFGLLNVRYHINREQKHRGKRNAEATKKGFIMLNTVLLAKFIQVAKSNGCALHEHENGAIIFELPKVHNLSPVLVTADEGESWTPDVISDYGPFWKGNRCLEDAELEKEIHIMYGTLCLGKPDKMLQLSKDLENVFLRGKIFS